jgi:hypothetical protein
MQRPWSRMEPGVLEEQGGGLCGWSRGRERDKGRREAGRGQAGPAGRTWALTL